MNIKSPFSLYDFIGYFFPGFISISIFIIYYSCCNDMVLKLSDFSTFNINNDDDIFINDTVHTYAFIIIISYITGHLINYLSSITIEKYSIWMYGYPSHFLLNIDKPRYYKFNDINEVKNWILKPNGGVFLRLLRKIKKRLLRSKSKFANRMACMRLRAFFWRFCLKIILLPITLLDFLIGRLLGLNLYYTNRLDQSLVILIKEKTNKAINGLGVNNNNCDFQRIINHYYYEKFNNHNHRLDNYVSLYGFLRSLSLIFSVSSLLFLFENYKISGVFAVIAYIFYMAFMKYYRRFSLENYMCFLVDENFKLSKLA